jgi:hypothetical protein
MRTQAIGDAGDNDTVIKFQLQKLKNSVKEVYHRKFSWNGTQLSIDGLFIDLVVSSVISCVSFIFVEVQEILGRLRSPDDLLSLWKASYDAPKSMRDAYSTLIAVQNQQAKQNRTSAVTHSDVSSP